MTTAPTPRPIHVERTADPAVLRWVLQHVRLGAASPGCRRAPEGSPLGLLTAEGSITDVTVRGSTVLIGARDPHSWPDLAPRVQTALLDELDALDALDEGGTHWLLTASDAVQRPPSIAEIQQIVDRAAGSVIASHGGAMRVMMVDHDSVQLRTGGACTGCRQSDETIVGLIRPALRAAYPGITEVTLDEGVTDPANVSESTTQRVPFSNRVRRRKPLGGGSCH